MTSKRRARSSPVAGATFSSDVLDRGFGLTCMLDVPGADAIMLYEPRHATAYDHR